MGKKRIAIISPSLRDGGAERIAGLLSRELAKEYEVYLFLENTQNPIYDYAGKIIDISKGWPFFTDIIREYKKKLGIDVSISFLNDWNMRNIKSKVNDIVIISERCSHISMNPKYSGDEYIIRKWYNSADCIVTCSKGVEYELKELYGVKAPIRTIYNFIDKEMICSKAEDNISKDVIDFLDNHEYYINVGRLHRQKRQEELIKQFSCYIKEHGGTERLLIIGSGELDCYLNEIIKKEGVMEYIRILPYEQNPFRYMKRAKALILTSSCEGYPNVVAEAFSLGIPVISVDCFSGPKELLDDDADYSKFVQVNRLCKRGVLIPFDFEDKKSLPAAIQSLNGTRDNLSVECSRYIELFNNNGIFQLWTNVIENSKKIKETKTDDYITLLNAKHIWIYGAGIAGQRFLKKYKGILGLEGFAVSDLKTDCISGFPVKSIDELKDDAKDICFVIGTTVVNYRNEMISKLEEIGYSDIVVL